MKRVVTFELKNGKKPLLTWIKSLDKTMQSRIVCRMDKLQEGYYGDLKAIDSEIKELRFKFSSGYRIYFYEIDKVSILLLCGGDKSTQQKDIEKAKKYLKIWKEQKNG
jgi:putative addiction module killer protein